jgi:hypothetical protein
LSEFLETHTDPKQIAKATERVVGATLAGFTNAVMAGSPIHLMVQREDYDELEKFVVELLWKRNPYPHEGHQRGPSCTACGERGLHDCPAKDKTPTPRQRLIRYMRDLDKWMEQTSIYNAAHENANSHAQAEYHRGAREAFYRCRKAALELLDC